jgi:L-asparaginase II
MLENLPVYTPVFVSQRGDTVESVHFGAAAVVNSRAELIAMVGNPEVVTYLRSSAKPFQVMPFLENGGADFYQLTGREVAVMCSSHSGTIEHVDVISGIQAKIGVSESDLLCGVHYPLNKDIKERMLIEGEEARPNHHNCSGMHTALVSREKMLVKEGWNRKQKIPYTEIDHPVQSEILSTISDLSGIPEQDIKIGTDGCSVPSFALPLRNAALAYARLCDPENGGIQSGERAAACRLIYNSMTANANMVAGPERFDTRLMQTACGRVVAKSGADGVRAIGIMPGYLEPGSPGLGIFIKISDGDEKGDAGPAVAIALLDAMGALDSKMKSDLADFGPSLQVRNCRDILVGVGYPVFELEYFDNIVENGI